MTNNPSDRTAITTRHPHSPLAQSGQTQVIAALSVADASIEAGLPLLA